MAFEKRVTPSFFSTTTKSTPCLTNWHASESPVGPAPTINTSVLIVSIRFKAPATRRIITHRGVGYAASARNRIWRRRRYLASGRLAATRARVRRCAVYCLPRKRLARRTAREASRPRACTKALRRTEGAGGEGARAMNAEVRRTRPDTELARMAAEGDAAAFEEIHRRYRRLVYNVALRMTGNAADAEDLTQESFVSCLRSVGGFRGEASFATWLYRLAVNQVKMHFRRRRSRPVEQSCDEETRG